MLLDAVASNVESTLAFTLSVKIVDLINSMQMSSAFAQQPVSSSSAVGKYDAVIMLCVGILLFAVVSGISQVRNPIRGASMHLHDQQTAKRTAGGRAHYLYNVIRSIHIPSIVRKDMKDIASHVLLLAFSRMTMQQIRLKTLMLDPSASVDSTVFNYAQRILEIMFVVTMLSCILTMVFPMLSSRIENAASSSSSSPAGGGVFSGSLANRQLNSLMVNMQRTFAETVASFVTDLQTRKMIVLLGLCMLPSISSVVSGGGGGGGSGGGNSSSQVVDIRNIESFFLGSISSSSHAKKRRTHASNRSGGASKSYVYANFLAKLWIAGLSMAWMNTTLGFILPSTASGSYSNALGLWMRVVSTVCLAVLSRSLQPMFPGLNMFQAYIEWSIATSTLTSIRLSSRNQMTTLLAVFCTGLAFYVVDALYRDTARREQHQAAAAAAALHRRRLSKNSAEEGKSERHADAPPFVARALLLLKPSPRISNTLQTLQSVAIIMFTNSLVSWSMEMISGSGSGGGTKAGLGQAFATVVTGIVVARVIVQIVDAARSRSSAIHH